MTHINLMSPAYMGMHIGSKEIKITKADMVFSSTNNSHYEKTLGEEKDEYFLTKGSKAQISGEVVVSIVDAPDAKTKDSISAVHDCLKKAQEKLNPKDYTDDFLIIAENSDHEHMIEISFKGFIKDIKQIAPEGNGFVTYQVSVVMYDPETFKLHE